MKHPSLITRKYGGTAIDVAYELQAHPDLSSKELAGKLHIPKGELLSCYQIIQKTEELQDIVISKSRYPRLTVSASELLSSHSAYVTDILSGKRVYPLIIEFHPGPVCQCHCKFCFSLNYEYGEYTNTAKPISSDRVSQIFKDCRDNGVEEIWFSGGKEPFVNPETPRYLQTASKLGFRTRLYTNGIALNQKAHEAVLSCYQIRISINGATPDTYHKVQFPSYSSVSTNGFFEQVKDNVRRLVKLKKERGSGIKIGLSQILQPDNHAEMIEFAELARELGADSVHFRLEAMGMVRDFTPDEKETIQGEIRKLRNNNYGIEVDIRGVDEGEFESRETQFLPGLRRPTLCRAGIIKRGLNPYGALYYCEFSSHPRFQLTSNHLRLGDTTKESVGEILRRHVGNYPPPCPLCQAHEYGLNVTLGKLEADLKWGIPVEKQPYYKTRHKGNVR